MELFAVASRDVANTFLMVNVIVRQALVDQSSVLMLETNRQSPAMTGVVRAVLAPILMAAKAPARSHAERRFQRRHTPHRSAEKNESGTRGQNRTQRGLQTIDLSSSAVHRIRNIGNRLRLVFGWDGCRSRAVVGPCRPCHATKWAHSGPNERDLRKARSPCPRRAGSPTTTMPGAKQRPSASA